MKRILPFVALLALSVTACGQGARPATLSIGFQPAAFGTDTFSTGPTTVTVANGCVVPDNLATLTTQVYGDAASDATPVGYSVDDLDADCKLNMFLPTGSALLVIVRGYDADGHLIRKGMAELDEVAEGQQIDFPTPFWPASGIDDTPGDGNGTPELLFVEVMRQFDQFVFELGFTGDIAPATARQPNSVGGYLDLIAPDDTVYTVLLDASERGLPLSRSGSVAVERVDFDLTRIPGSMLLTVPYASVGAPNTATDVVNAPNLDYAVTILDPDDAVRDEAPNSGFASVK
ncbi:MAG: hypothetical protein D6761_04755 [Candidatus Dadabacteria bacterium]|nr:MAG: hypothetical protein D6761_04755 [Candidatus Dadabacteria bacterium]